MDFILKADHSEHDASWSLFSTVHDSPVCLGCVVEIIENPELLPLQRKPALTEFQRLLVQQQNGVLQLFMQEERIVWHIVSVVLDSITLKDEAYVSLCIEVLLKIVQVVGSDDLVTTILDKISHQVESVTDHLKLLPHYTLLGKLIFQLPALVHVLLWHYDLLLYELSMDLCTGGEVIQSAVAYIFIFLCDGSQTARLSTRVLQQLHTGIITMLSSACSQPVQINGLGLLKKLVTNDADCQILMSVNDQQMTLLSCLKKILLGKKDVLQTGVSQILWLILKKESYMMYAAAILNSDIVEFLFESLHTENTEQIECIFKVLQRLSCVEQFYKRCHSVYGVESILRALTTSIELKHPSLLKSGYCLLADILNKHPDDVPLFLSSAVVEKCLCVIQHGLEHHQTPVFMSAQDAFTAMLRRKYLLSPVPFIQLKNMFSTLLYKKTDHIKVFMNGDKEQHVNSTNFFAGVEIFLEQIKKCCLLVTECKDDLTACESNFSALGSQSSIPSFDTFTLILVDAFSMICSLMNVKLWNLIKHEQFYIKFLEAMCSVNEVDPSATAGFCFKLVSSGVVNGILDAKVKHSSQLLSNLTERLLMFISESSNEESFVTTDLMASNVNVEHIQWPIAALPKVFSEQKLDIGVVESYLWILFLSYKFDNCVLTSEELAVFLSSITSEHTTLEQLSPIARKHYIYLLAYLGSHGDIDVRQAIPDGLQNLPSILQGTDSGWYTHDTTILEWIFSDPVLAGASGQPVIEAFLNNSSMDSLQQIFGTTSYNETDVIYRLCGSRTFIGSMLSNMATCSCENLPKYRLLLENQILHRRESINAEVTSEMHITLSDVSDTNETDQLTWMYGQITKVIQDIFLKNYSQTASHNLVGLLNLLLLTIEEVPDSYIIDVKILYHVMNTLCKEEFVEEELFKSSLLTVLTAVTANVQGQNSVCGIVTQNEGFMGVIQNCVNKNHGDTIYCIACDILSTLVSAGNLKTNRIIDLQIVQLIDSVCQSGGDCVIASMNLLTALFNADMSSHVVNITDRIYPNVYRTLYIHLQQTCMQDAPEYASSAVRCIRALIHYLYRSDHEQYLGDEFLSQPWNRSLIDVSLDLALGGTFLRHHLSLFSFFLETDKGCDLIKSVPRATDKLLQLLKQVVLYEDHATIRQCSEIIQLMVAKFEDSISKDDLVWLKEKIC